MLRPFLTLIVSHIWNCRLVDCQADTSDLQLRLCGGGRACAGRVEIYYHGSWGTVCRDSWDLNDANVVCRQLGCGHAVEATIAGFCEQSGGQIWLDEVKCSGTESHLWNCPSAPWGRHDCVHEEDVSVKCSEYRMLRLVSKDDQCSGRLEVQYGATWGTVCDLAWDMDDANVVCSQLHCGEAVSVPRGAYFGQGTGIVRSDVFECKGNETSLWDCPRSLGTLHCDHTSDVSVICSGNHGPRLVGGKDRCSGLVEVLHGDEWGTVCDQYFSLLDAGVVCEQLQCGAVVATPGVTHFGRGSGPVWKENYHCQGNESRLVDCPVLPRDQMSCSHGNDAGLICSDQIWSLRLINGDSRCDGRVEVYHNGRWGRVQDSAWNINDSNVVCRELGCGSAIFAYNSSRYGESELPVWVNNVQCEGNESQLRNCRTSTLNQKSNDVGVLCSDHLQLRLSGGGSTCAGRVEIYYHGSWGTVCDDSWDLDDANVVCGQLGCGHAVEDKILGFCGRNNSQIWLDEVRCSGNESHLWNCPSAPWGRHDCSHKEDVKVKCSEHKEMRLVNGGRRCEGRVEVWYNGTWGTVCSENLYTEEAGVICKQLECGPLASIEYDARKYGKGSGPIWMDEMKCSSHESALWQCQFDPWGQHNCDHREDAGISCKDAEMPETTRGKDCDGGNESKSRRLPDLQLRLDGGSNKCSGWVEILFNNSWGTVCDDSWDLPDANVVCRQLGCGSALWTPGAATIAPASGDIWLDEVKCTGSESFLSRCLASPLGQHDCDHKEDVFVTCSGISLSELGNKPPSTAVVVCTTLGILLIAEFVTLVIIARRQSARRDAEMRDRGFGFYEAIYAEIDDTLPGNNFSQMDDSIPGSIESMNQIEYYTSDPLGSAHSTSEVPEGIPSSVRDLVPDDHDDPESKIIDHPGCQFPMDGGADDLLMLTVAGGDVNIGGESAMIPCFQSLS